MTFLQLKNKYPTADKLTTIDPWVDEDSQIEEVLEENFPFPAYSIMLGLCEDGVPLLLDLTDPYSGSFLIAADDREVNFQTLLSLLTSTYLMNNENEVNIHLISPEPGYYSELHKTPSLKINLTTNQPGTSVAIEEFVNLIRDRKAGGEILPFHILVIEDLPELINVLNPPTRQLLRWLVEQGPNLGIWVIATMQSSHLDPDHFTILESFPSRILGYVRNPSLARYFSGMSQSALPDPLPGVAVVVSSKGDLISIKIPRVEN
jgi:hypothetical protein